ncbi:MAG: NAD(P)H-dependent oxidoreductase [Spirochaetota bacterium]|nr:NAD(P)H-dependent oxidoreductase [Spirochaetota bacterium]
MLLFVFPLYVDSMPGITKAFFELMENYKEYFSGKPVYFIIHSGFPEMIHSKALSRYLSYFSGKIMNMNYKGTVIIGWSEALQLAPDARLTSSVPGGIQLQDYQRDKMMDVLTCQV